MKKTFIAALIAILVSMHACKAMDELPKVEKPLCFYLYKVSIRWSGPQKHLWSLCEYSFMQREIAYLLATEKVDINHVDKIYQSTPLMQAMQPWCIQEHVQLMEFLIEKGASVNPKIKGATPLHRACSLFIPEYIEILLKHGAILDSQDYVCRTPIDRLQSNMVPKSEYYKLTPEEITKQEKVRRIFIKLGFEIIDQDRYKWLTRAKKGQKIMVSKLLFSNSLK